MIHQNPYRAPAARPRPEPAVTIGQLPSLLAILFGAAGLMFGGIFSPPAVCLALVGLGTPARRQAALALVVATVGAGVYAHQWIPAYRTLVHYTVAVSEHLPAWFC